MSESERQLTEEYSNLLRETLGTSLETVLADVAEKRPADPVEYLAASLYRLKSESQDRDGAVREQRAPVAASGAQLSEQETAKKQVTAEKKHAVEKEEAEKKLKMEEKKTAEKQKEPVVSEQQVKPVVPGNKTANASTALAEFPCLYAAGSSKWPIRCFGKFDFNVNSYHGGCAGILLISCSYGGKGEETTGETMLLRGGFNGNHYGLVSVAKSASGHFGCHNVSCTDEQGDFIGNFMFGNNHAMLMTNYGRYGNLDMGVVITGPADGTEACRLPVDVNGFGVSLVLCSGQEAGTDAPVIYNAAYMVRCGFKDKFVQQKLICGADKWKFGVHSDAALSVSGVGHSRYSVVHNKGLMGADGGTGKAQTALTQATDGKHVTSLLEELEEASACLVLCSNSNKTGAGATVAALYYVAVESGKVQEAKLIAGNHGDTYEKADLWVFEVKSGRLTATGPDGPCRLAVLSNIKARKDPVASYSQNGCIATGEPHRVQGSVKIDRTGAKGTVDRPSRILVKRNHAQAKMIEETSLRKAADGWKFQEEFTQKDMTVGLHIVRVFAVRKHVTSGEDQFIELDGSPCTLTIQKPEVVCSVNCGGPAYHAVSDIVYASEHQLFANFSKDFNFGCQSKAYGGIKTANAIPNLLLHTFDGFLHATLRSPGVEAQDEKRVIYTFDNISNRDYILRVHVDDRKTPDLQVNGVEVSGIFNKVVKPVKRGQDEPNTAYVADIPVKVTTAQLVVATRSVLLCGFALLSSSYKDKSLSQSEVKDEETEKQVLADTVAAMSTSATRKGIEIVGWSPNLLKNASGEANNLSHWNISGNWKIHDGGYGTEKAFVSSCTACVKYQEVNLLDHFSAEYLDTAPDIQVSEWYREGIIGGGFYTMVASLLNNDGKKIKSYTTGEIGTLYKDNVWQNASTMFSSYGPGVRIVAISTTGKDDKYWAGHYGTIVSASVIRVKRETKPADGDKYCDIVETEMESDQKLAQRQEQERLVMQVLQDNQDVIQDLVEDSKLPVDAAFEKQTKIDVKKRRKARKKREVRVFVSSTFRDFTEEREEIIKKAFREINRLCADRGVFFTYIDLRWGITPQQTETGKTIAICLQEIDRCRPYFICLMGDRFGWSQKTGTTDKTLNDSFDYAIENNSSLAWIDNYRYDSSVTQLEIFHGVLNNPLAAKDRSFFYMRDQADPEKLSPDDYKRRCAESEWHAERQHWLKSEVRKHSQIKVNQFSKAVEVAELIKKDLEWCVDDDFPRGTELTKLQEQREAHEAFRDVRVRVYIGREEYFTRISDHRKQGHHEPLVLLGESGSGKSALVANWTKRAEDSEPDTFVFVHFIGSSPDSASYIKLLHRLYEEMKEYFGFEQPIPSTDAQLVQELSRWLTLAGSRTKCVIVFDALNQLDDGSGQDGVEHDLLWIPRLVPDNVFLLLSTLPGRAMAACSEFKWPTFKVDPLDTSMKEQIVTDYLEGIYGKTLGQEQKQLIINAPQTNNPLYLRSLLDEVRMYGKFRTLTQKIEEYLTADSPGDLFAKILERLEEDFENGDPSRKFLVRDTTVALWCSNRGMSEAELIELLEVPSVVWSPFYLSLVENLVNRNGVLNFFHDHLRQAVQSKYLSTPELKKQGYLTLANYFAAKPTDARTVEELPYLLTRAGELERLKQTVSNLDVFYRLSKSEDGILELVKAWRLLGDYSNVEKAYMDELAKVPKEKQRSDPNYHCQLMDYLATFFTELGLLEPARNIYIYLQEEREQLFQETHGTVVYNAFNMSWRYAVIHSDVLKTLDQLGDVYMKLQDLPKAAKTYRDCVDRQNRVETPSQKLQLCQSLMGLATTYVLMENMAEAKKLMVRALELATDVLGKRHHIVAAIFSRLGQLSYKQGRITEALGYYLQDLKVTRSEVGSHHPRTGVVLNEIALVYDDNNNELAGKLYETALSINLDTFGPNFVGTAVVRYNLGAFYFGTNHFEKARYQFTHAHQIFQSFLGDDHPDTKAAKVALESVAGK